MIPQTKQKVQSPSWQQLLANGVADTQELLQLLALDEAAFVSQAAHRDFTMRVPRGFVDRMQKGDWHDPLLRQVLPHVDETVTQPGFVNDPLQEQLVNPLPGLLHKYNGRVLLTLVGSCAINCRYCFRRHFPYAANNPGSKGWQRIIDYIASDDSIKEVILSGGDPLLLNDDQLQRRLMQLSSILHIKRLRIHSRLPIVLPQRITSQLIDTLERLPWQVVIVIHCNHANEIDETVVAGLKRLHQAGFTLLNQSVLLKGVNDSAEVLVNLSERLAQHHVLPYYLHQLDPVAGTQHFAVPLLQAKRLMRAMSAQLSGYLVPKLVYEKSGAESKIVIDY